MPDVPGLSMINGTENTVICKTKRTVSALVTMRAFAGHPNIMFFLMILLVDNQGKLFRVLTPRRKKSDGDVAAVGAGFGAPARSHEKERLVPSCRVPRGRLRWGLWMAE